MLPTVSAVFSKHDFPQLDLLRLKYLYTDQHTTVA
jgi:hypothetical protein